MRIALEIAASVRANLPDGTPLFFRLSCVDWRKDLDNRTDGWTIEDSFVLARELAARGVDLIDCSSGGIRAENSMMDYKKTRTKLKRGHQVPYAEAIRREAGIPTMAVGVILDGPQAEAILAGRAGRPDRDRARGADRSALGLARCAGARRRSGLEQVAAFLRLVAAASRIRSASRPDNTGHHDGYSAGRTCRDFVGRRAGHWLRHGARLQKCWRADSPDRSRFSGPCGGRRQPCRRRSMSATCLIARRRIAWSPT